MAQATAHPDYQHLLVKDQCLWELTRSDRANHRHHVVLPGGLHSNGYFRAPTNNPSLMRTVVYELYDKWTETTMREEGLRGKVDVVVGPERETALLVGLFTLRVQESLHYGSEGTRTCVTKKLNEGTPQEDQEWVEHYTGLAEGNRVLVLENVVTTGTTATQTVRAIRRYAERLGITIEILPAIGCILNRTQADTLLIDGTKFQLVSYQHKQFTDWPPDNCPLCQEGSIALDPRTEWDTLMKSMEKPKQ